MVELEVLQRVQNLVREILVNDPDIIIPVASLEIVYGPDGRAKLHRKDRQMDGEQLWNYIKHIERDEQIVTCYKILRQEICKERQNNTPVNEEYQWAKEIAADMMEEVGFDRPD